MEMLRKKGLDREKWIEIEKGKCGKMKIMSEERERSEKIVMR